ncbi:MAG TPA: hypothetical protein VF203_01365 [Burkholderiales bacterium]
MPNKNAVVPLPYPFPIQELLYCAAELGSDFERPGKRTLIEQAASSAASLHLRTMQALRFVKAANDHSPAAKAAIEFLTELRDDFAEVARLALEALERANNPPRLVAHRGGE